MLFSWKNKDDLFFVLKSLVIFVGLSLAVVSWLRICSEECAEVHNYRFYGLPFEPLGFAFFTILGGLLLFSRKYPFLNTIIALMTAGAVGSELVFIGVQKYVIGQWCPVCLSIAGTVGVFALLLVCEFLASYRHLNKEMIMSSIWRGLSSISVFAIGFTLAFCGVAKPDTAFAEGGITKEDPVFGNLDSPVEVYVFTDWFCPACRQIEPSLDKIYPKIMKRARLIFVDEVIHPESMNFVPYNLSFMVKEKKKYFEIRKALAKLAKKTKTPTPEEVQEAVKPFGVTYQQLNYMDVQSGIHFFEGASKTYEVHSTPTIVVTNRSKLNAKKLTGSQITEANIMRAIDEMGGKPAEKDGKLEAKK